MDNPIEVKKPKNEFVFTLDDVIEDIDNKIAHGLEKGEWVGFNTLYDYYSVQKGSMTFVIAEAGAGKSSFLYELMLNLSEYSGWKWGLFSPEAGSVSDLYLEIMWAYARKPVMKHNIKGVGMATKSEVEKAKQFVREHFYIIDSGLVDLTPESYFKALRDVEIDFGVKLDGFLIDPFVEIDYNRHSEREDVALGKFLNKVRKHSSAMNMHGIVTVHTKNMQPLKGTLVTGEDVYYTPQPTYNDAMSGKMWQRKGYMILSLWRPPAGLPKPNPMGGESVEEYKNNETVIEILKIKPKITGKKGKLSLFYDWGSSRFYDEFGSFSYPKEDSKQKKIEEVQEQLPF